MLPPALSDRHVTNPFNLGLPLSYRLACRLARCGVCINFVTRWSVPGKARVNCDSCKKYCCKYIEHCSTRYNVVAQSYGELTLNCDEECFEWSCFEPINLACTAETSATTAGVWGALFLTMIVVHNAAAGQLSLGVGAGMLEMVIANDSSQHFFHVGDQNADMSAVDAKPQEYVLLFQLPA